jgi:hypothetical protein
MLRRFEFSSQHYLNYEAKIEHWSKIQYITPLIKRANETPSDMNNAIELGTIFSYNGYCKGRLHTIDDGAGPREVKLNDCDYYFNHNFMLDTGRYIDNNAYCAVMRDICNGSIDTELLYTSKYGCQKHYIILPEHIYKNKVGDEYSHDNYFATLNVWYNTPFTIRTVYDIREKRSGDVVTIYKESEYLMRFNEFIAYKDIIAQTQPLIKGLTYQFVKEAIRHKRMLSDEFLYNACDWTYKNRDFALAVLKLILSYDNIDCSFVWRKIYEINVENEIHNYGGKLDDWLAQNCGRYTALRDIIKLKKNQRNKYYLSQLKINAEYYLKYLQSDKIKINPYNIIVTKLSSYNKLICAHTPENKRIARCWSSGVAQYMIFDASATRCDPMYMTTYGIYKRVTWARVRDKLLRIARFTRIIYTKKVSFRQKTILNAITRTVLPLFWATPADVERAIIYFSDRGTLLCDNRCHDTDCC